LGRGSRGTEKSLVEVGKGGGGRRKGRLIWGGTKGPARKGEVWGREGKREGGMVSWTRGRGHKRRWWAGGGGWGVVPAGWEAHAPSL
jgi:hypothetical protein